MPRLLLFTLYLLLLPIAAPAQQRLATARQRSYLTKVFRLSEEQTRHLYEHDLGAARPEFFTQPVDSFPSDSARQMRPLPPGYYLVAHTEGPQLVYWLRCVTDREVVVVDNQVDLTLVVRDSLGRPLEDARVALARRPVPFDAATRAYRLPNRGRSGLLAVTQAGRTTFHVVEKQADPSTYWQQQPLGRKILWVGRRLVFGFPLGYLTKPVWNLGHDLKHVSYVSTGPVGLLRSAFSEDVRAERRNRRAYQEGQQWTSYVALSKPKYRPAGDTLHLKVRLLRRPSGRPGRQPLTLWLGGGYGQPEKKLAVLRPVRPGSYEYTLPLTDTLGLRADTRVGFRLENRRGQPLVRGNFQLEDYELKSTRYTLRVAEKEHRRGQPQAVFLRGTDSNDLNLLDARVRLSVTPRSPLGPFSQRQLFLPDTLWTRSQALDPTGETRLNLPAGIFPEAEFSYAVGAVFLNADNERRTETTTVPYGLDPGKLQVELAGDSVRLRYLVQGQSVPHAARLEVSNGRELGSGTLQAGPVQLPLTLPVDPRAASYELSDADHRSVELELTEANAGLSVRSDRTHDSIFISVDNPRRLPFWYFVYRANTLVQRGYGSELQLQTTAPGPETWSVSVHYLWGEELRKAEYSIPLPQRQLIVRAEQPEVAYPGQKIRLQYTVTDGGGRPVPGVDLTSYAYTSKFGQAKLEQNLPSFEPRVVGRRSKRRFALKEGFDNSPADAGRQLLPWAQWRHQLGLDSLRFYQFLYPESGAFYQYEPAPGGLTQLAPFVVDSGRVEPPVAVYLDGVPVYVYEVNQHEPYALVAEPGRHTLSIRTATRLVTLHDVYLRHLHKLTLSIDVNQPCAELTVEKRRPLLTPEEKLTLTRSLLVTETDYTYSSLRQGNVLRPVSRLGYHGVDSYSLAGPFRPDSVLLRRSDGLRRSFLFEPLYRYYFAPGLVKLTSLDPTTHAQLFGSLHRAGFPGALPLGDFALTEAAFQARYLPGNATWAPAPPRPGYNFKTPLQTPAGQGRLEVRLPPRPADAGPGYRFPNVAYLLLTQPGNAKFHRLQPHLNLVHALPAGRYRVAVLLADSTSLLPTEEVVVAPDGVTYFQLRLPDRQPGAALRRRIGQLLPGYEAKDLSLVTPAEELKRAQRTINITQYGQPQPGWRTIRGQVTDRQSGEGLPGVTVLVEGTTIGAATNADGTYALQVPNENVTLTFSSIGYVQEQRPADQYEINVALKVDTKQLSEVVVVAYGTETSRRSVSYATATVSNQLAGKVAGVQIRGAATLGSGVPGGATNIFIRGVASLPAAAQPLIILDGLPFNGRLEDVSPSDIASVKLLKDAAATATYGARAANGVLFITTKASGTSNDPAGRDPRLALRRNFRDYAWWRPTLITDAQGRASTDVTLPDDVTGWDTFVLGSDDHGRVGSATQLLRSFKALLAELAVPRFLIEGDQTQVLGKTLNYTPDSAQVSTGFAVAGVAGPRHSRTVRSSVLDTLSLTAPTGQDSVLVSYDLRQASGYADGEQRPIPVLRAGTRENIGTFAILAAPDTTLTLPFDPQLGPVTVRLESDALPVLLSEIQHLQQYAYLCNEQAASKLKALLLEKQIRAVRQEPFNGDRSINFLIRKLLAGRHQPENLLWGTWAASEVSPWATTHVLEALLAAEKAGYKVRLDRDKLQPYLLQELDYHLAAKPNPAQLQLRRTWYYQSDDDLIRLLRVLHQLGTATDYRTYVARLERSYKGRQPLDRYLALTELRQQLGLPYQLDSLRRYRLSTQLGGVFYADTLRPGSYYRYLLRGSVGSTLLAYRLLRAQGGHEPELTRIRFYLLNLRRTDYWTSTYEAAQILETIGPDLLAAGQPTIAAKVQLSGTTTQQVSTFPQQLTLPATAAPLTLRKTGLLPVYATAYQTRWNPTPEATAAPFTVKTELAGQTGQQVSLRAGQPAELVVTVNVTAEARYVLLEVPIPAGCSYGDNKAGNYFEVHREYLRHQTGIFIDRLPVGVHTFRIALQPRYRGRYTLNPAKAELMYFPTRFGRSASKQVRVQ
ncbi:carboxypeptidase-like regulatory domain-containing protein [Hymenobacter chitinivorans]|uniref:TonB-dependent SusC/RagA subfamily outer membrane receptor n=1 Tax=Hymenobacter chitinivorans DSM 11115 TaxID=1121954 RepID=A0A2M9BR58_9BACT|nr:carboxypeptidase-like regulatory domain-containing protein [Hymenobacter chitinivorans]PJJ60444.1 TonB-dependent SusC/RagA subfamily outer membrane receptor [Hymenobacter chitinivorans DSM 11115]